MFAFENNNKKYIINTDDVEYAKEIAHAWTMANTETTFIESNEADKLLENLKTYNRSVIATAKDGDELAENETEFILVSNTGEELVEYCRIKNWGNTPRELNQIRFCHDNMGEFTGSHKCSPHHNNLDVWFYL